MLKEKSNNKIINLKEKPKTDDFLNILRLVAPGTKLRTAIEGTSKMGRGALIIVENEKTKQVCEGGFRINSRLTPQKLMELSKMDGAITLSNDMKRINQANVTLIPDSRTPSDETGTRHKAAERTAKLSETLTIAVSEKKKEVNIYYKNIKYHLREISQVLRKATDTLQILEKQRDLFDKNIEKLNEMELRNDFQLSQACKVIQKGKSMQKILKMIEKDIIELGKEAQTIKPRIKEIMQGISKETDLIIKDYTKLNVKKTNNILDSLSYEELVDNNNIFAALAQEKTDRIEKIKGWRILTKTILSEKEISEMTKELDSLGKILYAKKEKYEEIFGEKEKSETFSEEIYRIKTDNFMPLKR